MNVEIKKVDEIIERHIYDEAPFVPLLQDINSEFRYLPKEALKRVSQRLEVPLSRLFNLATFYKCFSLVPRGENEIQVCMGTACHVRGSSRVLERICQKLQIDPGETTEDQKFTLETVNCVGACALGPLLLINGKYEGRLSYKKIDKVLEGYHEDHKESS